MIDKNETHENDTFDDTEKDFSFEVVNPLDTLMRVMEENKPEQRLGVFLPRLTIISGMSKILSDPRYKRTVFPGDIGVVSRNPEYNANANNNQTPSWVFNVIPHTGRFLVFGGHEMAGETEGTSVTTYSDRKSQRFLEIKAACPIKGKERWPTDLFFGVNYPLFFPDQKVVVQWHAKSKSAGVSASELEKHERKGWFSYSISEKVGATGKPYHSLKFEKQSWRHKFNDELKDLTWFINAFWGNTGQVININESQTKQYLESIQ